MVDTTPIFFWRETHPQWGWLSQWYECEFEHEGTVYVTAEMWMMIQKAKLFGDEVCSRVLTGYSDSPSPTVHCVHLPLAGICPEDAQDTLAKGTPRPGPQGIRVRRKVVGST